MPRSRRELLSLAGTAVAVVNAGCSRRVRPPTGKSNTDGPPTGQSKTDTSATRTRPSAGDRTVPYRDVTLATAAVDGPYRGESYCRVESSLASDLDVEPGMQLRVRAIAPGGDVDFEEMLFTVAGLDDAREPTVWARGADLATIGAADGAAGEVSATVPHPAYRSRAAADANEEFVERVFDPSGGRSQRPLLLAPHGGYVEYGTGKQATHAADRYGVPAWVCWGFNDGGGAYDRWHVTATEIHPASFPGLAAVSRRVFPATLAFHGQSENYLAVGGGATRLRRRVTNALRAAYDDAGIDVPVRVAADEEIAGDSPENVVNWTAEGGGVQLEQPSAVRESPSVADLTAKTAVESVLDVLD